MSFIDLNHTNSALIIDPAKCSGCNVCHEKCPEGAIHIQKNYDCLKCIKYCHSAENISCKPDSYIISISRCNLCGICLSSCPENAVKIVPKQ